MGLKLSCIHHGSVVVSRQAHLPASPPPARVIAADGSLKELPAPSPSTVSAVLGQSGDVASSSFFVCNSDGLYFNERPPALAPGEMLRPGQIYFLLPVAMLERPLSTADMTALAVRATTALASSSSKPRRHGRRRACGAGKKKAIRVVPIVREETEDGGEGDVFFNEKLNQQTLGEFGVVLLSPAKKDEKVAAAAATSRLKRALSIIQEDAE